jgi:hypothetical protein
LSQSVWPGVFMHTVANALSATLVAQGFVTLNGPLGVVFSPGTEGLMHGLLFGLAGLALYW